jgi:hypothetical protein
MARIPNPRALVVAAGIFGFSLFFFNDPQFCESMCGNISQPLFSWLFEKFGPWGPRSIFLFLGAVFVWLALKKPTKRNEERG